MGPGGTTGSGVGARSETGSYGNSDGGWRTGGLTGGGWMADRLEVTRRGQEDEKQRERVGSRAGRFDSSAALSSLVPGIRSTFDPGPRRFGVPHPYLSQGWGLVAGGDRRVRERERELDEQQQQQQQQTGTATADDGWRLLLG
jgi:hypothetical protein